MKTRLVRTHRGKLISAGIVLVACCLATALSLAVVSSWERLFLLPIGPSTGLSIYSQPSGGTIYVNGEFKGRAPLRIALEPGEYLVSVEAEGHVSWKKTVHVKEGQVEQVVARLVLIPYLTLIAPNGGSWPEWEADGTSVFYVTLPDAGGRLMKVDLSGEKPVEIELGIEIFDPDTYGLSWNEDRSWLLAWRYSEEYLSRYLVSVDLRTVEQYEISGSPPEQEIVFLGHRSLYPDRVFYMQGMVDTEPPPGADVMQIWHYELWTCNPRGQDAQKIVELLPDEYPTGIVSSPEGDMVLILEPERLWIVNLDSPQPVALFEERAVEEVRWSPDGQLIGYVEADHTEDRRTLGVISPDASVERELVSGPIDHFRWYPDGSKIVYFAYDPSADASSCWAIDVDTGERSLLADESIVTQRVGRFAISPDGNRIALEGGDGNIWLLTLKE